MFKVNRSDRRVLADRHFRTPEFRYRLYPIIFVYTELELFHFPHVCFLIRDLPSRVTTVIFFILKSYVFFAIKLTANLRRLLVTITRVILLLSLSFILK